MIKVWSSRNDIKLAILVVACLVAGWFAHGIVAQPADVPAITGYDSWQLVCPKRTQADQSCALAQNVVAQRTGATVLRFVVSGNAAAPTVDVYTVLNVLLPAGLGLKLDDQAMKVRPYRTCNGSACIVTLEGDGEIYRSVLNAKRIQVFFAGLDGKTMSADLSMSNYKNAVAALNDSEAKRHSWLRRVFL